MSRCHLATIASDVTTYPHDDWLPMTIAWVTKPDQNGTATRIIARISGTIVGVLITVVVIGLFAFAGFHIWPPVRTHHRPMSAAPAS